MMEHVQRVRAYGEFFDDAQKVLVFSTMEEVISFAALTLDPMLVLQLNPLNVMVDSTHDELVSGKQVLSLLSTVVHHERFHRLDTIVVLPTSMVSKEQSVDWSVVEQAQFPVRDIVFRLYYSEEMSLKECSLTVVGTAWNVDGLMDCLHSALFQTAAELHIVDVDSIGDLRGGSSRPARDSYALVQETLL
jgi:hypothetical protein